MTEYQVFIKNKYTAFGFFIESGRLCAKLYLRKKHITRAHLPFNSMHVGL
jgi:hypothetical protein